MWQLQFAAAFFIAKNMKEDSVGHDPVKELGWHPVYGQAVRRKLGPIRKEGDPGRYGRFAAIEWKGHTMAKKNRN